MFADKGHERESQLCRRGCYPNRNERVAFTFIFVHEQRNKWREKREKNSIYLNFGRNASKISPICMRPTSHPFFKSICHVVINHEFITDKIWKRFDNMNTFSLNCVGSLCLRCCVAKISQELILMILSIDTKKEKNIRFFFLNK